MNERAPIRVSGYLRGLIMGGRGRRSKEHGGHKAGNGTGGGSFLGGRVRALGKEEGEGLKGPRLVRKSFSIARFVFFEIIINRFD